YKGVGNVGVHIAHLWTSSGTLLASATFSTETPTGWQSVTFPAPVSIAAGTVYIASYYAPAGHYSDDDGGLALEVDSWPLHALPDQSGAPNGVYGYGQNGTFPAIPWFSSNYWVDVVFVPARVVGRYIFYNDSAFDGNDPAANVSDDGAIAPDKRALLPESGLASAANYTGYSKGINGIMVDMTGLPGALTASDFSFQVSAGGSRTQWIAAPTPSAIVTRKGGGIHQSDRIEITWPGGAIRNQWLQVTVDANQDTGLLVPDVFYFGNLIGQSGDPGAAGLFTVTLADESAARSDPHSYLNPASITDPADYNKDGRVDALDQLIARYSMGSGSQLVDMGSVIFNREIFYNDSA